MTVRKTAQKKVIHFEYERDTKNKVRFNEPTSPGEKPHIGKLYLIRETYEALGSPRKVSVTLETTA